MKGLPWGQILPYPTVVITGLPVRVSNRKSKKTTALVQGARISVARRPGPAQELSKYVERAAAQPEEKLVICA